MSKKEIILIGGGGHCKSCIEVIESTDDFSIAGIVDMKDKVGSELLGYKIIGSDEDLPVLREKYDFALVTVGQIKSAGFRKRIFEQLRSLDFQLPVIIASTARVSKYASIGQGTIIMHQVFVNANAKIGENCIINSKALIEHDAAVGDNCHISTNSTLNGDVTVGKESFIASNVAFVNGKTTVGNVIVGIGSVVDKDLTEAGTYIGHPIRKIK